MSTINRQWLLTSRPKGMISEQNFKLTESEVPPLKNNQVLLKNVYLSFDPTQRIWSAMDSYIPIIPLGSVIRAIGLGQVIESNRKGYLVIGLIGWQKYCVVNFNEKQLLTPSVIPGLLDPVLTLALSGTGLTAYFGLKKIGKPKKGETVLVSGAAGTVGSVAFQLAKLAGYHVVTTAGFDEKCQWLKDELHADATINYKTDNIQKKFDEVFKNGIDVYSDKVGGEILEQALSKINSQARIILCGNISGYNEVNSVDPNGATSIPGPSSHTNLIIKSSLMQGFVVTDYFSEHVKELLALTNLVGQGKLQCKVDMQSGFKNIPATLQRIFTGKNIGKQLLKLCDLPLTIPLAFDFPVFHAAWNSS